MVRGRVELTEGPAALADVLNLTGADPKIRRRCAACKSGS